MSRLCPQCGVVAPERKRRPAKGAYPVTAEAEWTPEELGERAVSDKKVRKVRRDLGVAPEAGNPPPA